MSDNISISIEGRKLKLEDDYFNYSSFEFSNRCYAISEGKIHFFGNQHGNIKTMDNGVSYLGKKVKIEYGSFSKEIVFAGFVSGIKSYNEGYSTSVDLLVSSPEFWMLSGKTSVSWNGEGTYSDILDQILSGYGSKFDGTEVDISYDLPVSLISLPGTSENDYDYVKRISKITGSFFYSLDGNVKVRTIEPDSSNSFKLEYEGKIGEDYFVKKIKLTSNIMHIPKSVSYSYIKDDDYENPISLANELDKFGSGNPADSVASNIDDSTTFNFSNLSIDSDDTAKYLSKAEYKVRSINLVKCEITCSFWPEVKVGGNMTLSNFSKAINNTYIITSVIHRYEALEHNSKFITVLTLNSDAMPSV